MRVCVMVFFFYLPSTGTRIARRRGATTASSMHIDLLAYTTKKRVCSLFKRATVQCRGCAHNVSTIFGCNVFGFGTPGFVFHFTLKRASCRLKMASCRRFTTRCGCLKHSI